MVAEGASGRDQVQPEQRRDQSGRNERVQAWLDRVVPRMVKAIAPEQIILFGSFARGTATRRSDIDLLVTWETSLGPLDRMGIVLELLKDAPLPVETLVYTPDELQRNQEIPFLRRVLREGRVMYDRTATE